MTARLLIAALTLSATAAAARDQPYSGRPLADVLRELQADGLRIFFTTAIVTADLRVAAEPRAATPRERLDELLAPHGLAIREGPGGILQVVRANVAPSRGRPAGDRRASGTRAPPRTYREHVTVSRPWPYREDPGVASETTLDRPQWQRLHGSRADDPMRAVHALPRVVAADDVHSEFAVRGSSFRHADVVIDGVSAPWLRHTAYGRGATGSLAMFGAEVVGEATLRTGAFPHRHGDRLGAELELSLREGSRDRFGLRGAIGGSRAIVLAEGPVGRSARGSWLAAGRRSFLEWPPESMESSRTVFGFSDALAKLAYDVRPGQRLDFSLMAGSSNVDADDDLAADRLRDGMNRAWVVNAGWRSSIGSSAVLKQRVSVVRQRFVNEDQSGAWSSRGSNEEMAYRADLARRFSAAVLEAGVQVARTAARHAAHDEAPAFAGSSWRRSGYLHVAWAVTPALTLSPGLRVTGSSLVPDAILTRWMLGEWNVGRGWTVSASAGVSHQLPALEHVFGAAGAAGLRPERATHVDVALEQRVTPTVRWQVTLFNRRERDILRQPDASPRLVDGAIDVPDPASANALRGSSRGVELLVDRRSAAGLSGWAAYSYGRTRYRDASRGETFWGDFDQRHAFTLVAEYRVSGDLRVGATLRAGSGLPVPGYFAARDGRLFVAGDRNEVRLPAYARMDVRADRGFEWFGRRLTIFGEVLNVLNRANAGPGRGFVVPSTGEARGFTVTLLRRRASAGVAIEF